MVLALSTMAVWPVAVLCYTDRTHIFDEYLKEQRKFLTMKTKALSFQICVVSSDELYVTLVVFGVGLHYTLCVCES